ncbi:hypothetical protein [Aliivibrio sp. 1S128]|uniref:hypothetical protein n=1 Tax=Aliivibrio sp. 1S128 TaxID=1840085 RepID=UPI00080E9487|nr:hypothetical protein [Aliivibrio sp. 1S128]OCH11483.1 hypothetical protein A6E03_04235 [Aliivibrio sp. 1S128]
MAYYNGRWHLYSEAERRDYAHQQKDVWRQAWHNSWISKTGLKQEKNWTDAMIAHFLARKEENAGKIKAYSRTLINRIEKTKAFKEAMIKRETRQRKHKG